MSVLLQLLTTMVDPTQHNFLRERLIAEMRAVFADDNRRIDHALEVLRFAETIQCVEGGDPATVQAAAVLHDIGIQAAECKHGSAAGHFQELEGPPIARPILERLGLDKSTINHVCRIIASHHSGRDIDTLEFRIIWDSDWLVNIPVEHAGKSRYELRKLVDRIFCTKEGRRWAYCSTWIQ